MMAFLLGGGDGAVIGGLRDRSTVRGGEKRMIRRAKTIAEFKIRKHLEKLEERGLVMDNISFEMKSQNEAELTDVNENELRTPSTIRKHGRLSKC